MRPSLTKNLSSSEFRNYYWLKEELQAFCREQGMRSSGSKIELANRIERYLATGQLPEEPKKSRRTAKKPKSNEPLSLDTVIAEDHRCSQQVRAFFQSAIGQHFHFSTYIQNYFKTHIGNTYRDAVTAWYEEEKRKKEPDYQKDIPAQFEYNTFVRDYFADPINKGKTRQDAIDAWNVIKKRPGSNRYEDY